jgi:hypothetical protein
VGDLSFAINRELRAVKELLAAAEFDLEPPLLIPAAKSEKT